MYYSKYSKILNPSYFTNNTEKKKVEPDEFKSKTFSVFSVYLQCKELLRNNKKKIAREDVSKVLTDRLRLKLEGEYF